MSSARAAKVQPDRPPRAAKSRSRARLAASGDPAAPSPARNLQNDLAISLTEPHIEHRWAPRTTLAFVVGTCGLFWTAVFYLIHII